MSMRKHWRRPAAGAAAVMAVIALTATSASAATATAAATAAVTAAAHRPEIKLIPAQRNITIGGAGGHVNVDPGIWIASLGAALQLNVQRASYAKPLTITQVYRGPGGKIAHHRLPGWVLGKLAVGMHHFLTLTVKNAAGQVVYSTQALFCPNTFDPERAVPNSPASPRYPQECLGDPFPLSMPWGIQRGWAVDPLEEFGYNYPKLPAGVYHITETVNARYRQLLHISARDATATVRAKVVKGQPEAARLRLPAAQGNPPARRAAPVPANPASVPSLKRPPRASLPDLVALPSWGIDATHQGRKDLLDFGATVWIGHAPLDVEGFRSHGSPTMKAYQYFSENGHVVGRLRAGTMGFDSKKGHHHWHFEQFARYQLLTKSKSVAVRSHKQGFCIAPTDPVDLLHAHAPWAPGFLGFNGQCGIPTALWVTEYLPQGWGDTYFQDVAGQSFNITNLKNGTYYLEVIANPGKVLHETTTRNDISLRKVILGGKPGHRTVRVPAWHGLDRE